MEICRTERLILRHFGQADLPNLKLLLGDVQVMEFSMGTLTGKEVEHWLEARFDEYKCNPNLSLFALEDCEGNLIGYCGLGRCEVDGVPEIEIGYRILPASWGNGLATEAGLAVCQHAFEVLHVERLVALIDPVNLGSVRVAEKLGMAPWKEIMLPGYTHPDVVFKMSQLVTDR